MKRIALYPTILLLIITLCSCSSDGNSDTYFVHAIGFDKEDNNYVLYCVCEKLGDENSDFFTAKQTGTSIKEAISNMQNEYKECYFSTAELFVLSHDENNELISNLATELCDNNFLPTKSNICTHSFLNTETFLNLLKSHEDLKQLKKISDSKNINVVKFFSKYMSENKSTITKFEADKSGKIKDAHSVLFKKDAYHE